LNITNRLWEDSAVRIAGCGFLLTGASRGIGRALALELARRRCRVALVARDLDSLQKVAAEVQQLGGEARCFPADVGDAAAMGAVAREASGFLAPWHGVVANAGVGLHGPGVAVPAGKAAQLVQVNLLGVLHTIQAAFTHMERPALLGVVSSLSALIPYRGGGVYAASKAGVNALLRCLALELGREAVVGVLCPGPVATGMIQEGVPHRKLPRLARWLVPVLPPEKVARRMVRLFERGGGEAVIPWQAAFFASFYRHFPKTASLLLRLSGAGEP
jgi:short-subunit dehydrogenase